MTEGSTMGDEDEEFVQVLKSYSYQRDGRTHSMYEGEILMLLKRSTEDWWQVIRNGQKRPFFAPRNYVKEVHLPTDKMKDMIKEGQQQQQTAKPEQTAAEAVKTNRPQDITLQQREMKADPSTSYITKIERTRSTLERSDSYSNKPCGLSSFKSESPVVGHKGLPLRSSSQESPSPSITYSQAFVLGSHESSSSHTSKSSLNDGCRCSTESLPLPIDRKHVMKAASHDELTSGQHRRSTVDVCKPRAASSEELDSNYSSGDYFKSNQLSSRHRSNSVDFRFYQKELPFTEIRQGFFDNKSRKVRLSKDSTNRRRSWAVEEVRAPDSYRGTSKKTETKEVPIVIDVPPKLPPKQRKHRPDIFNSSSSENGGKLEGPIDLKLQEVKIRPTPPSVGPNVKRLSLDYEKGHSRQPSDPLVLMENQRKCLTRQELQEGKDPPVALPRKIIPPEATAVNSNSLDRNRNNQGLYTGIVLSDFEGSDSIVKDYNQMTQMSDKDRNDNCTFTQNERIKDGSGSFSWRFQVQPKVGAHEHSQKTPGTPDSLRKVSLSPNVPRKLNMTSEPIVNSRGHYDPYAKALGNKDSPQLNRKLQEVKPEDAKKEAEKENEIARIPLRETPTPDSMRGGRSVSQTPPSPRSKAQRLLFEDWGEYYDESTGRPFYFNSRTREKRWKPPRKGIYSVAIPEVPTSKTRTNTAVGRGSVTHPRSPPPDYPVSPKTAHKPWSYSTLPDGVKPLSANRSSSLTHKSSLPLSSHTLPPHVHPPTRSISHFPSYPLDSSDIITPPPAPPSSAKPNIPFTPTTIDSPNMPDIGPVDVKSALVDVLYNLNPPKGWEKKYDAYTQRVYFRNLRTKQKWMVANNEEGKIYYYEESEGKSQWNLPQEENVVDERDSTGSPASPNESLRISLLVQKLPELSQNVVKEGFLHRTFFAREGKKARKHWTQSYAQFIKGNFDRGCSGLILFTKTKDDYKKPDMFEFYPNCSLEDTCDKKTSRQQVLGLRNGHGTEVLLQFEDKEIASEWFRVLQEHEGMQYITALAEEKKGKRGTDKMKRSASMECLSPDSKGITDKLRNFIKRRPLKETLEKKGIYKEAVFGSTLAELSSQDKTLIPIFVLQCIQHIEKTTENLRTDGLYRISGNAAQIQKIRFEVAQRKYCVLSQEKEVHNLSGSLKLFFRELKEPLIPYVNYKDFIEATGSEYRRMNQQEEKLAKAVRRLPTENYETLKFLLQHLLRVSEFEKENRMSLSNLAIVFGPCLLWPESSTSHDLMTDVMLHNRVIEGLLKDFTKVFASKR